MTIRIGVLGFGSIGKAVAADIAERANAELAFVWTRRAQRVQLAGLDQSVGDLTGERLEGVDLVVEAAAPEMVKKHAARILTSADLMLVSAGALADDSLRDQLTQTAHQHGHRLLVPRGAVAGLDALTAGAAMWKTVRIAFVKPPGSIDPPPEYSDRRMVLFDGPVRNIAAKYPRNVNAMVTCALATLGLEDTQGVLISDPSRSTATLEIEATGRDGSKLSIRREQPMVGVSGTEMPDSVIASLRSAIDDIPGPLAFV